MTRDDPELGPVKFCTYCGEWWPLDHEFWYFVIREAGTLARSRGRTYIRQTPARHVYSRCRACWLERSREHYARATA